jgi:Co/Zn/Cd efflux system component
MPLRLHRLVARGLHMSTHAGAMLLTALGWLSIDPLAGVIGACVIASWSYGLIRDTSAILLDINPDEQITHRVRRAIEADGDHVADLHLWRLGLGHLGAIMSVSSRAPREPSATSATALPGLPSLSHVTVEVERAV